jgi:hypothetical protein
VSVVAAAIAVTVLTALGVLQVLVAAGRPYGRLVWGGRHETLPRRLRVGSALSVLVYAAIAGILAVRAAAPGIAAEWITVLVWIFAAYFALGVVVNGISRSRLERAVMTPVCVVLAVCSVVIALA